VDDLKLKITKLTKYYDRSIFDKPPMTADIITVTQSPIGQTAASLLAETTAARPSGHGVPVTTQVDGIGENYSPNHSPANGMHDHSTLPMAILIPPGYVHEIHSRIAIPLTNEDHDTHPHNPRLPKFNFPVYDGETTKLWITQAEDYFDMYGVPSYL
jgi:hypothetical protein